ncbi:Transmembrane protein [Melia azedarach]|uniref:Transmembrane protein n=1 Tax=Melia azedarach TaxID=155640 RepID=A0ACC1WR90_MELAZ|nr:Transmembrane protein [Melia azedarach]
MATSTRRQWFLLGLMILMMSTQFSSGDCRVFRPTTNDSTTTAGAESVGMTSFPVSSNNSNSRSSTKNLAFTLASGPSKRGPGH